MDYEIKIAEAGSDLILQALELRREVFVAEQGVPIALEIDEYDDIAIHFAMLHGDMLVGTLRLLEKGVEAKIGRVSVKREYRGMGLGKELMLSGIAHAKKCGFEAVILDSQVSSLPFYRKLGFLEEGDIFDDAGIPHMRMRLNLSASS